MPTGLCTITSNPWITMGYMAAVGWLLSKDLAPGGKKDTYNEQEAP